MVGLVSFGFLGKRGKKALQGRKSSSSPACACLGERDVQCRSKQHCFPYFSKSGRNGVILNKTRCII